MRIALYEPDIPQNTGTILRLCACFGIEAHIIEPAGFDASDRAFRRAGMDYLDQVKLVRHAAWPAFEKGAAAVAGAVKTRGAGLFEFGQSCAMFGRECGRA
jgi:tRNA (cytidine/uridine-2'-O-)-methyltransferase